MIKRNDILIDLKNMLGYKCSNMFFNYTPKLSEKKHLYSENVNIELAKVIKLEELSKTMPKLIPHEVVSVVFPSGEISIDVFYCIVDDIVFYEIKEPRWDSIIKV